MNDPQEHWLIFYKCALDERGLEDVKKHAKDRGYVEIEHKDQIPNLITTFVKGEYFLTFIMYQDVYCVYGFVDFEFPEPFAIVTSRTNPSIEQCRGKITRLSFEKKELRKKRKTAHILKSIEVEVECPRNEDVENTYYVNLSQLIGSLYMVSWAIERIHDETPKLERLDEEINRDYNYMLPSRLNEEFIYRLSKHIEKAGRVLMRIEQYKETLEFHLENVRMLMRALNITLEDESRTWDVEKRPLIEAEHRLRIARTVWNRLLSLRDMANGLITIKMQKSSHSLHFASLAIEFLVIFVYIFELWEIVNPRGFKTAPGILKALTPPVMASAVILITEALVEKDFDRRKSIIYLMIGLSLFAAGLAAILWHPTGGAQSG